MNTGRNGGTPSDRGQLGFDFLVGMSVFLITVAFVIGFVPGMFDPFVSGTGSDMITADRSAAHLTSNMLVDSPSTPKVLNTTCTVSFFDSGSIPSGCRFDTRELSAALGFQEYKSVNITIENGSSIRTISGVTLSAGSIPPDGGDVTVAQRVVFLDGTSERLFVRVW